MKAAVEVSDPVTRSPLKTCKIFMESLSTLVENDAGIIAVNPVIYGSPMKTRKNPKNEVFEFDPPLKKCGLCGSGDLSLYHVDFKGIHISCCGGCGVQFMNPQYTDGYLKRYYSQYAWEEVKKLELEESL